MLVQTLKKPEKTHVGLRQSLHEMKTVPQDISCSFIRKQLGPKIIGSGVLIGLGCWALISGAVSMRMLAGE